MGEHFSRLNGNDATRRRLSDAIRSGTLPHAFLVIGPEGSGKRTLASELCAALNCERRSDGTGSLPCHSCNTCKRIADGNFTDIHYLKRNPDKATIGVEEVRDFKEDMFLSATESEYKIYIFEEAERLTPAAQNAMLTVLEEPPANVVMLLLAESGDTILTTIKSRAQSIFMQRFTPSELGSYLTASDAKARAASTSAPEQFRGILMSADGRIGRALSLLSPKDAERNALDRDITVAIIKAMRQGAPYSELYSALARLPVGRHELTESLETLLSALRDIILVKRNADVPLLFYTNAEHAAITARTLSSKRLLDIYDIVKDTLEDMAKNIGMSAVTAALGARIRMI